MSLYKKVKRKIDRKENIRKNKKFKNVKRKIQNRNELYKK